MTTNVSVSSAAPDFLENISARQHLLQCDEPEGVGGKDAAPTPYELLLAALGACKAITLRMYAKRRGWPLEAVHIDLSHAKVHGEDCANCDNEASLIDRIQVEIRLVGDLSMQQRQSLLSIAEKCPVHRTLASGAQIQTRSAG